jgi:glycosyltransferase involved in cell wall biosynthesis
MYPRFSQTFVVNEILELERQGARIRIISQRKPTDGMFHESVSRVKAKAHYIPEYWMERLGDALRLQWRALRENPGSLARSWRRILFGSGLKGVELMQATHVVQWARKHKIKHLHVHFGTEEANVALLARLVGGPSYSLTLHAFDIFKDTVNRGLLAEKINHSKFTVTVSEFNRRFLVEEIPGVRPEKVRVNYNGISLNYFRANGARREPNTIFSVGRLIEKKGFEHLVRAMARLRESHPDAVCEIAGDGREEARLRKMIDRKGLQGRVRLLGPLEQNEVLKRMQRATCFALPCVRAKDGNTDALPTVLLESLACGCPSVSTRLSGVTEIIEHGVSGLLVDPEDDVGLSRAIAEVLDNRSLAANLAAGGRARAEARFDVRHNVHTMYQWLAEAGNGKAAEKTPACRPEATEAVAT